MRFCTETLSAAMRARRHRAGRGEPVADLEALDGFGDVVVERARRLVVGEVAGDDQALAQQIVIGAGYAEREFRVRGNRRPAAAHGDVGIAERGLLDSLRGAFVEGRLMRQRKRLGRTRFGGRARRLRRAPWPELRPPALPARRPRRGLRRTRGCAAINVAMAAIAVLFIRSCPGKRRDGAGWQELGEIEWRKREEERSRSALAHESCVPIKRPHTLLHRRKSELDLWRPLICRRAARVVRNAQPKTRRETP